MGAIFYFLLQACKLQLQKLIGHQQGFMHEFGRIREATEPNGAKQGELERRPLTQKSRTNQFGFNPPFSS